MEEEQREKQTATLISQDISEGIKKERAKEILFSNISVQRENIEERKISPVSLSFENVFNQEDDEKFLTEEVKEETCEVEKIEETETINEFYKDSECELVQEANEEVLIEKKIKPKTNFKTRLKIAICAFALVLTCVCGWSIYNAVKVKTLTAELQAEQAKYSVNVVKVISNVQKLDDLSNPNSITNLDELEKAEVINIVPKQEKSPMQLEPKSNWFDRLCNWLSNLFN